LCKIEAHWSEQTSLLSLWRLLSYYNRKSMVVLGCYIKTTYFCRA